MHRYVPQAAGILAVLGLIGVIGYHPRPIQHPLESSLASFKSARGSPGPTNTIEDVFNSTLGFQEIFVVSLKERTDRQDAMTLQASVSNLNLTFVDAAKGQDIPSLALPHKLDKAPAEVGCWRSHLNVMRHVVENNIQTALIFEDDADWDVALRAQMREAADGFRWILQDQEEAISPYGDGWDLLWIGHTGVTTRDHRHSSVDYSRRWVISKDPTVVHPKALRTVWYAPNMKHWEEGPDADLQTRTMFLSGRGYGSSAWAVSQKGAQRILYEMSLTPYNNPIDAGMGEFCNRETSDMVCLAPYPAIIGVSKPAGPASRGSDILEESSEVRERATSERTVFSTRLNMKRILNFEAEYLSSNPDATGKVMTMQQITNFKGHGWEDPKRQAQQDTDTQASSASAATETATA